MLQLLPAEGEELEAQRVHSMHSCVRFELRCNFYPGYAAQYLIGEARVCTPGDVMIQYVDAELV